MRIGILSDNHGDLQPVRRAFDLFCSASVNAIVHCGDVGDIRALEALMGIPFWFVWGNTDDINPSWRFVVEASGGHWPTTVPTVVEADSTRIAVFHGHEPGFAKSCVSGEFEYILHGHTHQLRDDRIEATRIINPGALHRTSRKTVAVLDVSNDEVSWLEVQ